MFHLYIVVAYVMQYFSANRRAQRTSNVACTCGDHNTYVDDTLPQQQHNQNHVALNTLLAATHQRYGTSAYGIDEIMHNWYVLLFLKRNCNM